MELLPNDLTSTAQGARARLAGLSRDAATAPARGTSPQSAMAGVAQGAIFADALLAAMHARLEELRSVSK